jgi:hypothetical protein
MKEVRRDLNKHLITVSVSRAEQQADKKGRS